MKIIIDGENLILGRLGTFAAKQAMLGNTVDVVNAEKVVVSGKRPDVLAKYKRISSMGVPKKGPFLHRMPDRIVRRSIRGMLPYKTPRGSEAYARVLCHIGIPPKFEGKNFTHLEAANVSKLSNLKFITIHEISKELGAKI